MALHLRALPAVLVLSAAALVMTGCVPSVPAPVGSEPASSGIPTPVSTAATPSTGAGSSAPSTSPTPSAAPPSAAPPQAPQATAVSFDCDELVSPQAMYDFDPNSLLLNNFSPGAGSPASVAIASQGVACRWEHSSSGVTIDVSVAKPASNTIGGLKSNAGNRASSLDGYFAVGGGSGTAQIFTGAYWATVSSQAFLEAGDAAALVAEVRSALR